MRPRESPRSACTGAERPEPSIAPWRQSTLSLSQMHLAGIDWAIIIASLTISFIPALLLGRRAGSSTAEFFTSGQAGPWWLIGVSMVATTFSTDTPNLVTNLVREGGVAGNWAWWAFLLTGMMTVDRKSVV